MVLVLLHGNHKTPTISFVTWYLALCHLDGKEYAFHHGEHAV